MAEARSPEQMPTAWTVKTFAHEKGFGTLAHASGDEATFGIETWDVGEWKPSRKESIALGPSAPGLPQAGEPVRVRWKRSISGKIVPALVQPTGRVVSTAKEYKLGAWLKRLQRTGHLAGLTPAAVLKALAKVDEDRIDEWRDGEPREASDFAFLLMDLANLDDVDPEWVAKHAGWIYSDDHRWDRDRARNVLPAMLGVETAPEPAPDDANESLTDYAARCNANAATTGAQLRLHEVALDADVHLLVAMRPADFTALVEDGYLDAD